MAFRSITTETVKDGSGGNQTQPVVVQGVETYRPVADATGWSGTDRAQDASERAFHYAGKLGIAEGAIASALISLEVGRPDWALQTLTKYMEERS